MIMEDFENQLINIFNECSLPYEAKRYIVLKFANDVDKTYYQYKNKQLLEERKGEEIKDV